MEAVCAAPGRFETACYKGSGPDVGTVAAEATSPPQSEASPLRSIVSAPSGVAAEAASSQSLACSSLAGPTAGDALEPWPFFLSLPGVVERCLPQVRQSSDANGGGGTGRQGLSRARSSLIGIDYLFYSDFSMPDQSVINWVYVNKLQYIQLPVNRLR